MSVGPDPVGTYLRTNAAMMEVAANYAAGAATGYSRRATSLVLEINGLSGQDRSYVYVAKDRIDQTDPTGRVSLSGENPRAVAATIHADQNSQTQEAAFQGQAQTEANQEFQLAADDGTPGDNQRQNKQIDDIVRMLKLTKEQRAELHMEISGKNMGFLKILKAAKDLFGR